MFGNFNLMLLWGSLLLLANSVEKGVNVSRYRMVGSIVECWRKCTLTESRVAAIRNILINVAVQENTIQAQDSVLIKYVD